MAVASQKTSDTKGDHLSAHMFGARGATRMTQFDAAMTASSNVLDSASANFSAADVGKTVTVPGAGSAGAPLVTTIASIIDASHADLLLTASTSVTGKAVYIGIEETQAILDTLIPFNGDGSGVQRLIPTGNYFVAPGSVIIPNPQSALTQGHGSRFNSCLVSIDPTSADPILQLGDGTNEPHSYALESLTVDANFGAHAGALYLNRTNLMAIRDVIVQHVGVGGIGVASPASPILFAEMIFDHLGVLGGDDIAIVIPVGSKGIQLYPTGNLEFYASNVEQFDDAVYIKGSYQQKFLWIGGHIERVNYYAFILENVQPDVRCNVGAAVWLGNDVVNGDFNLANTSHLWPTGAIVDNGFGNRIRLTASNLFDDTKAAFAPGLNFDGDEWLSVPGISPDPTFLKGATGWTGTNAAAGTSTIVMPGVKAGASLTVTSSALNGYAEKTFTATANTDYLLQVGLMTVGTGTYRVQVLNSGGSVWDSGNFNYPDMSVGPYSANYQAFRVIRKSIPVTSDTVFKVRIYAVTSDQVTVCPLLLISASAIQMNSDFVTQGTGFTSGGSGVSLAYHQNVSTGSFYAFKAISPKCRAFARAVVTVPAGLTGCFIGVNGDANSTANGPQVPLREGTTAEYIIPLSGFPTSSTVLFYSFTASGTITVAEMGVYAITDPALQLPTLGTGTVRNDVALGISTLTADPRHVYLGDPSFNVKLANVQSQAEAGNGFMRLLSGTNIEWDTATQLYNIGSNGSSPGSGDWAAWLGLNGGIIAFACEGTLTLPTTRTQTQVTNAIKLQILPDGSIQFIYSKIQLLNGGIESWILNGNGSPNLTVSAVQASLWLDNSGGFLWGKTSGGFSNTGWQRAIFNDSGTVDLTDPNIQNILPTTHGGTGVTSYGALLSALGVASLISTAVAASLASAKAYTDAQIATLTASVASALAGKADHGTYPVSGGNVTI